MRKFFKFILIAGGAVAALVVILMATTAIVIQVKYPPAVLKKMATDKLTEALKRKVSVGDVRFNILSGFEITQLTVSNRPGWAPGNFLSADDISISYHIFPLLWGRISLGQVELKNFQVLVERRGATEFNFSDMASADSGTLPPADVSASTGAVKPAAPSKKKKKTVKHRRAEAPVESAGTSMASAFFFVQPAWGGETSAAASPSKTALSLSVDSVRILHGKMTYLDETTSPPQRSDLQDLNLTVKNISLVGGKTTFDLDAPFSYNKTPYQVTAQGSFHYFLASQTLQELAVTGTVNGLAFGVSGDFRDMTGNYAPDLDGSASLDMLKFSGLVPASLSKMPEGLNLTGPAKVDFHLGGNAQNGLELSGTADGSKLALAYKDLFVKTADTTCKVEFKTLNQLSRGIYDVPLIKVTYNNWEVSGAFHYRNDGSFSGEIHSKALPFEGLPAMIPKLKRASFDGTGSVDVAFSKGGAKKASLNANGQILLKGVGITLPQEPYLENMTGAINFTGNVVRVPGISFSSFDGTGEAGVTYTFDSQACGYAFNLKNVDAQKAIDSSIDAYITTKDFSAYKDKLYGKLNLVYAGLFRGLSGGAMVATSLGTGSYSLTQAKVKGFSVIKTINQYFKDSSDEIDFDQIAGNLGMKNKVFSYTANCVGKVGQIRETGGIDVSQMVYSPDMMIQCDIKKSFVNSDAAMSGLPAMVRGQVKNVDWLADGQGNIPVDVKFTGAVSDNHYSPDFGRLSKNVESHIGDALKSSAQGAVQDLGNKLKGLFGN
jgi:hypothetical protein